MTVRTGLIILNVGAIVVIGAIIVYRVLSVRRNPEPAKPQNLTPFYEDSELEGPKLERVLRWALFCSAILAVGLPIYWLHEPSRQKAELKGFDKRSVERGATLFANNQMKAYDQTKSLLCANCHGTDAGGGSATFIIKADVTGTGRPAQVSWKAPALNTELQRYTRDQVTNILVYGRPGTPMPAWGIAGGGPKGDQSISDLVNYIESIQLTPAQTKKASNLAITHLKTDAAGYVQTAQGNLTDAQAKLAASPDDASLQKAVAADQQALTNSESWLNQVSTASRGELLFDTNCARCHTQGWSYFDPSNPTTPLPRPPGSGGTYGPKLNDGDTLTRFPGATGYQQQIDWVTVGIEANKPYGQGGVSTGRMPHFADTLSADDIKAIVNYERTL